MRLQARMFEKLEEKIFPASRDIPCDENGDGLFTNLDTIAVPCVDPPPARPRRDHPYDNNPAPGNLHIPQSVLDHNDPDKNPGTGASPFPPIDIDKPAPKYPYHPSHGPKSAGPQRPSLHRRRTVPQTQGPGELASHGQLRFYRPTRRYRKAGVPERRSTPVVSTR